MEKFTQEFILRLKNRHEDELDLHDCAINFLSEQTETPKKHYDEFNVYKAVRNFFSDYIRTCDHHNLLFYDFMDSLDRSINCHYCVENGATSNREMLHNITNSMLFALQNVQVREHDENGDYYCINGFTNEVVCPICDD